MEDAKKGPIRAIVLGYGIRGRTYADYAKTHPDDLEIAALADPVAAFPADLKCPTFKHWEEALVFDAGVVADVVIISLPDRLHYPAAIKALEKGYHILLEKPVGCTWDECKRLKEKVISAHRIVLTGYVLRYAEFYRQLREVLNTKVIGDLVSIHHLAAISFGKSAHSYCRGNWSVEEKATGMLVNKCTHDFDLIEWWTKGKKPFRISSFGSLQHWRPENKPAGAADRCHDCPESVRANCPFDAYKLYYERKDLRYHFADESDAAIQKMIETSPYGRCVYACGNDSVDHQTVLMEYQGGLTVTMEMESYSQQRDRVTHFYGTRGEIVADEHTITIMPFIGENQVLKPESNGHHGGGDREIMSEFIRLVRTAKPAWYSAIFKASLESHRLAFAAEKSRLTGTTVYL